MKTTRSLFLVSILTAAAALSAFGQTNPPAPTPAPVIGPDVPPIFEQATNQTAANIVFNAALNLLPAWDPSQTNDFGSGEFCLESAPLWKTASASGTTPFNSTEGDYFFTRNVAAGAELISLGTGTGSSTIDSGNLVLTLRKDSGNIAGYLLTDIGYNLNDHRMQGGGGPGLVYQYRTHLRLFLDTRFNYEGVQVVNKAGVITQNGSGFLTRIGIQIPF